MNVYLPLRLSLIAVLGLSACSHYGQHTNYANDGCGSLAALYGNDVERAVRDVNAPASDLDENKPGEINLGSNANLYKNERAKRDSDLRAAYRKSGCGL